MRRTASVRVPATSANLGPGFDTVGLALGLYDEYRAEIRAEAELEVEFVEGGEGVPADETNLVVRSLRAGLTRFGVAEQPGLRLSCRNVIPHGRGLGSSAAAIVGGVRLAAELAGIDDSRQVLQLAAELEGHPDNVAACLLGGYVVSWADDGTYRAASFPLSDRVTPVIFIPAETSPTAEARTALPPQVPLGDAVFNAGRAALLTAGLCLDPDLLLSATRDRLHQEQRRPVYPRAMALVDELRANLVPACISGAGPSVLAFSIDGAAVPRVEHWETLQPGFHLPGAAPRG